MHYEKESDSFVVKLPALSGYKTLLSSLAVMAFGVINALYPEFQPPTPGTVELVIGQLEAVIMSLMGLYFGIMRLVTTGPVGSKRERSPRPEPDATVAMTQAAEDYAAKVQAYNDEYARRQRAVVPATTVADNATADYLKQIREAAVDKSEQNTDNIDVDTLPHNLPDFLVQPREVEKVRAREDTQ